MKPPGTGPGTRLSQTPTVLQTSCDPKSRISVNKKKAPPSGVRFPQRQPLRPRAGSLNGSLGVLLVPPTPTCPEMPPPSAPPHSCCRGPRSLDPHHRYRRPGPLQSCASGLPWSPPPTDLKPRPAGPGENCAHAEPQREGGYRGGALGG